MASTAHLSKMGNGKVVRWAIVHEVFHRRTGTLDIQPVVLDGVQDTLIGGHHTVLDAVDNVRMAVHLTAGSVDHSEITWISNHGHMGPVLFQGVLVP
jgi:hypothetical protein